MTTVAVTPALFRSMLNRQFDVLRQEYTPDGQGGATQELVTVRTVAGRLRPLDVREALSAARLEVRFSHVLYVEAGDEPAPGEYFRIADDDRRRWRVVEVAEPSYAGQHMAVRCVLEHDPYADDEEGGGS